MEMYLMMLYVSLEQEEAVKNFFIKQGWAFQKPDLRVLTDHTGPLEPGIQETAERTSYEPSVAVPTFTVNPVETVIEHVTDTNTQSETVVKAKVKPKPKKRKEKSKDLGGSDKTEFQEILNEAELIAASVSQAQTVEDKEIPSIIKVKDDTEDVTFTVVQNDNEDTYDDYDDYNEQVMVEVPSTSVSGIAGDSVTQSPITETPRASKRKRREKNLDSDEWTDDGEEDEARVKETRSRKKRLQYKRANIQKAYEATQKGMSVCRAAKKFKVPESTLRDRTRGNVPVDAKPGLPNLFSESEELKMVGHIKYMNDTGKGFNAKNIKILAKQYAMSLGKDVKSAEHMSNCWYYRFRQRWPDIPVVNAKPKPGN